MLTGAGISAESGIRTFRAADGLWEEHRIEDVATPEGFARDPALVQRFYNERRALLPTVKPNPAHHALGHLEQQWPAEVLVVTQNIDNLHERGGSRNLIHLHGELLKVRCTRTGQLYDWSGDVGPDDGCRCCQPPSDLRPHVVWFGEMPLQLDRIYQALGACSLFISIGTSGNVYPAADFVREARAGGAHTVEINLEPSRVNRAFDEHHHGQAGELVPRYVERLLQSIG